MFKREKKDAFARGQSLLGRMRRYTKNYGKKFDDILESEYVDSETRKMIKETVALMDECCSYGDSWLALEKKRQKQLDDIQANIKEIKGLLAKE